ncbi:MAG: hypothetical protein ND866_26870 [Pyrinomonadaceae bacterium]|nr:hypothetical protein [Pyrinomonadaceae bacterium]
MCKAKSITGTIALEVAVLLALLNSQKAVAQSTLFNVPSTDVVAKKKVYLEFDFLSHFESHDDGGFQVYVPRAVFGVAKGLEVGINVSVLDAFAPDQPVYVSPNLKWQFYANEENGTAVSAGGLLYTPIANRAGADTYGFVYSVASKKVKGTYGPRLTGGAYGLPGLADGLGTQGGAILGYEQPIAKKVTFVADWFSGKNAFGYVTPGCSFTLPKSSLLNIGYSIGNQGRGNNALFVYYGITF